MIEYRGYRIDDLWKRGFKCPDPRWRIVTATEQFVGATSNHIQALRLIDGIYTKIAQRTEASIRQFPVAPPAGIGEGPAR